MKVTVTINGIPTEIDTKNIQVGELTLEQLYNRMLALDVLLSKQIEKQEIHESTLKRAWERIRGKQ